MTGHLTAASLQEIKKHAISVYYPRRSTLALLHLFVANAVVPLLDVPLLGLSITAVFFGLIAVEILVRSRFLHFNRYAVWIIPAYGIGFAVFLSLSINGIIGEVDFGLSNLVAIVQAIYWLFVFIISAVLISNLKREDIRLLVITMGASVVAVGLLRLYEATVLGRVGTNTARIMSQNGYGVLFSAFSPFALAIIFLARTNIVRLLSILGFFALLTAIVINGSRSSWITVTISIVLLAILYLVAQKRRVILASIVVGSIVLGSGVIISSLSPDVLELVTSRFETLDRFEEDRSYQIRVIMQQKAIELFQENPILGVGRGQFRNNYVELDFSGTSFSQDRVAQFNRFASHNSYLQYLAETGLIGAIPFCVMLTLLFLKGARSALKLSRSDESWAPPIFASLVSLSIHLWSIDNLQTTGTWLIYGLAAGMICFERRQNQRR